MLRFLSYLRRKHEVNILWNLNSKIGNHLPVSIPERERPLSRQDLVRTTYRTEKKSVPVRIFSYQNPYHVPYQVRVRTKIRTTYRTEKIRTKNPYHVPKSVPVRIFGTILPFMHLTLWWPLDACFCSNGHIAKNSEIKMVLRIGGGSVPKIFSIFGDT